MGRMGLWELKLMVLSGRLPAIDLANGFSNSKYARCIVGRCTGHITALPQLKAACNLHSFHSNVYRSQILHITHR